MRLQGPVAVVRILAPDLLDVNRQFDQGYIATRISAELQAGGPALVDDQRRAWEAELGGRLSIEQLVERVKAQLGLPENMTGPGSVAAPSGKRKHANYNANTRFLQEFLAVSGRPICLHDARARTPPGHTTACMRDAAPVAVGM